MTWGRACPDQNPWGHIKLTSVSLCSLLTSHNRARAAEEAFPLELCSLRPGAVWAPKSQFRPCPQGEPQISSDVWELRVASLLPCIKGSPPFAPLKIIEDPEELYVGCIY